MLSEHVVLGPSSGAAGVMGNPRDYAAPGNQDPRTPWPDSIVLMSAIAAVTQRLRLIGAAIIAPLRHPLLLAHQLAALDLLAEGRLVVHPTVSWHRDEYEALGVPFERRGELLDEHLAAWRAAWTQTPASFAGPPLRLRRRLPRAQAVPGRRARGCGSAAPPWRRGSSGAWSSTATGCIRSASRRRTSWRRCTRRWPRRGATRPSWRSSAASVRASLTTTTQATWTRRPRRSPRSWRPATRRSASSRRCSPTTPPRCPRYAAGWSPAYSRRA